MSNKDIKKGIAIQANADAAKVEKLARGMNAQTAVLKSIESGQEEIRDTVNIVLDDMSASEAKALYNLNTSKSPLDLDITEKRVVCACIYSLIAKCDQKDELQLTFYANLEQAFCVLERNSDFDFTLLNNIDSHTDRLIVAKVILYFLFLKDSSSTFIIDKEQYAWIYGFVSQKDVADICKDIIQEYEVLGLNGIVNRYNSLLLYDIYCNEQTELLENSTDENLQFVEANDSYEELQHLIKSAITDIDAFGECMNLDEEALVKELSKTNPRIAFDTFIAATKVGNGYLIFTTHALYLKTGNALFGEYVCLPYKNILPSEITTTTGKKSNTRKLIIPFIDSSKCRISVSVDDSKIIEEKLRDLILSILDSNCPIAQTDSAITLNELCFEGRASYLAIVAYIFKAEQYSLLDAYLLAEKLQIVEQWNFLTDMIQSDEQFRIEVRKFKTYIPYPSLRIVLFSAMDEIMNLMAHTNVLEGRPAKHLTISTESRIRMLDITDMSSQDFNIRFNKAVILKEWDVLEYIKKKGAVKEKNIAYSESIVTGIDFIIKNIENSAEYKAKQGVKKMLKSAADMIDTVTEKVVDGVEVTTSKAKTVFEKKKQ